MTPDELRQLGEDNERLSAAWRAGWLDGYAAAVAQLEAAEAAGYSRAIRDVKAAWHGLWNYLRGWHRIEERRWGPGGRTHFADRRDSDYPGREAARPRQGTRFTTPAPRSSPWRTAKEAK